MGRRSCAARPGPSTLVPAEIRLTLGVRDVLLLRNRDVAPHVFGQVLVLPGRVVRLPFEQAGDFPFACDLAPASKVTVRVLPQPDPGWPRLRWRLAALSTPSVTFRCRVRTIESCSVPRANLS
jgi:hypothetical protein